jgi:hypothetical protein
MPPSSTFWERISVVAQARCAGWQVNALSFVGTLVREKVLGVVGSDRLVQLSSKVSEPHRLALWTGALHRRFRGGLRFGGLGRRALGEAEPPLEAA